MDAASWLTEYSERWMLRPLPRKLELSRSEKKLSRKLPLPQNRAKRGRALRLRSLRRRNLPKIKVEVPSELLPLNTPRRRVTVQTLRCPLSDLPLLRANRCLLGPLQILPSQLLEVIKLTSTSICKGATNS